MPDWVAMASPFADLKDWVAGVAAASTEMRANSAWMPDHQSRSS